MKYIRGSFSRRRSAMMRHKFEELKNRARMMGTTKAGKYGKMTVFRCTECETKFGGVRQFHKRAKKRGVNVNLCWEHFAEKYGKNKPPWCKDLNIHELEGLKREEKVLGVKRKQLSPKQLEKALMEVKESQKKSRPKCF